MPSPMIASVAITCAARTITFTPDTSAAWRSYAEANTMPLYLPAADSPIELSGCDPYIVTIEPSAQAATEGWAFQIPGETARHARKPGTFEFAVSAAAADVETGIKTISVQRYMERNERRRDLARYKGGFPYRERGVHADTQTVVSMQLKRKLTAYDMRASSSVRPGRSTRREASWSLAGRTRSQEGVVTSTSLDGIGSSACNQAVGSQHIDCTRHMAKTSTPHPTTGTFRTNDDLHGADSKSFTGRAPRSPFGNVLPADAGSTQTQSALRRQAVHVQHGVGTTPARELLDLQPQYAYGSTVAVDATKPLRRLTANETYAIGNAFALFDEDDDGEIGLDELDDAASAATRILTTVGVDLSGTPSEVRQILAAFDLQEARAQETIARQPGWAPPERLEEEQAVQTNRNTTNTTDTDPDRVPEPEPEGTPEPEPEPEEEAAEAGVGRRKMVSITLKDFEHWAVDLLDQHFPGWTPPAPAEPVDLTESPWGYNEGHDEQQPLPTHFRKEERRLTYDQGATPFDDSEVTRRSWWHPKGQTEVVGENFDQPLPRSGFVDTRAEVDNRHRALAPPYDYEERVVPSYATSKRTDWDKPHS